MSEAASGPGVSNSRSIQKDGYEITQMSKLRHGATHGSIVLMSNACLNSSLYRAICGMEGGVTEMVHRLHCAR